MQIIRDVSDVVIGGADGPSSVVLSGSLFPVFLIAAVLVTGIILAVLYSKRKRK